LLIKKTPACAGVFVLSAADWLTDAFSRFWQFLIRPELAIISELS
jgi:hypothetical protein